MAMREMKSGEAQACHERALRHIERLKKTFTESTTDVEKFQAYLKLVNDAAHGTERCRENFQGGNHCRWNDDKSTARLLYDANKEGIILIRHAIAEMKGLKSPDEKPLCRVNGTKAIFMECTQLKKKVEKDFKDTDKVYHEQILRERKPDSQKPILLQKIEAIIAMIVAQFIFIPDCFLA